MVAQADSVILSQQSAHCITNGILNIRPLSHNHTAQEHACIRKLHEYASHENEVSFQKH